MNTPEGEVKKSVRALMRRFMRVQYHMPVQNGMGTPMLDFHACVNGMYLAIETKAPGRTLTPRQAITVAELLAAGAAVFIVDGPSTLKELEAWLDANTQRKAPAGASPAKPRVGTEHNTDS